MNENSFKKWGGDCMARTKEQNGIIREQTKEKIKRAALEQFSKKGLFATRIQDIALDAGIAQGLMYRYYASKDEIYIDLINEALDKVNEAAYYVQTLEVDAKEKIILALDELLNTIKTSNAFRQTSRLITQAMNSSAIPDKAQRIIDEKRDIPYQVFAEIMKRGQEECTIVEGDPYELAILFWSTVNGLATFYATRTTTEHIPNKNYILSMFIL